MSRAWIDNDTGEMRVDVCQFTFCFRTLDEIHEALAFYRSKTHPSSRLPTPEIISKVARQDPKGYRKWLHKFMRSHHAEVQRWFERAPLRLQKEGKRQRVVMALEKALLEFTRK